MNISAETYAAKAGTVRIAQEEDSRESFAYNLDNLKKWMFLTI